MAINNFMRLREILPLLEYDQSKTLATYGKKLNADDNQAQLILSQIEQIDPTKNKQYVVWLVKQHIAGQPVVEQGDAVRQLLTNFDKLKPRLEQRDINRYSLEQLTSAITTVLTPELGSTANANYTVPEDTRVLYNGPLGLLTQPQSTAASCELGSGTKWCTSGAKNNKFGTYSKNGELYIWRDRSGDKYQFWIATNPKYAARENLYVEIKDPRNRTPSAEVIAKLRSNPIVSKLLAHLETRLKEVFPTGKYKVGWAIATSDTAELIKSPGLALMYAKDVLDEPFPAGEKIIATDANAALIYASSVLNGRFPAAEPTIAADPILAATYAKDVLQKRWPEGEPAIVKDPSAAAMYAATVLKGPFPKAESVIATNPRASLKYALEALKGPFAKGEPVIAANSFAAVDYAKTVLKKPFPAGEAAIATLAWPSLMYARDVLKKPFPAGEAVIEKDPEMAAAYRQAFGDRLSKD